MTASSVQMDTSLSMWIAQWEQVGRKVATMAEAFPEEKFEHRPLESVRTFGEVIRHLAFWNRYVAGTLSGGKVDDSSSEVPLAACPTKAKMIETLERSSRDVVTSLRQRSALDQAAAELVVSFLEHTCEHYGQLAVYCRLAGITPPASRT